MNKSAPRLPGSGSGLLLLCGLALFLSPALTGRLGAQSESAVSESAPGTAGAAESVSEAAPGTAGPAESVSEAAPGTAGPEAAPGTAGPAESVSEAAPGTAGPEAAPAEATTPAAAATEAAGQASAVPDSTTAAAATEAGGQASAVPDPTRAAAAGGSYGLNELIAAGLDGGPLVSNLTLEGGNAQSELVKAEAARLPAVSAQFSASWLSNPPDGVTVTRGSFGSLPSPGSSFPTPVPDTDIVVVPDPESSYFQLKVGLSQTLFTWGKLSRGIEAANLGVRISRLEEERGRAETRRDIRQAWAGYLASREGISILERVLELYGDILDDRQRNFDNGLINFEQLLQARSQYAELESRLVQARSSQETALYSLRLLTGLSQLDHGDIAGQLPIPAGSGPGSPDDNAASPGADSYELSILRMREAQAELAAEISELRNPLRPDIALSVDLDVSGQRFPGLPNWLDYWDTGITLSLGTRVNLFDGGASSAEARQARIRQAQAALGLESTEASISFQLAQAREQRSSAAAAYQFALVRAELLAEQEKNARVAFENQLATREEALGASMLKVLHELEVLSAAFDHEQASARIEYLVAGP